jgi:hypothetical protein
MTDADRRKLRRRQVAGWAVILLILAVPAIVYVFTFGWSITSNHARWAEFGSAMSGLYSPLLAFLAFVVLIAQVRSQNAVSKYQLDHAYIDQARADIEFYLNQLDRSLAQEVEPGLTTRELLHKLFIPAPERSLQEPSIKQAAREFNLYHPRPFDIWSAIYPYFAGLAAPASFPYEHHSLSARQKTMVIASFRTCVALDNLHYILSEGRTSTKYAFSPDVPSAYREA